MIKNKLIDLINSYNKNLQKLKEVDIQDIFENFLLNNKVVPVSKYASATSFSLEPANEEEIDNFVNSKDGQIFLVDLLRENL